MALQSSALSVLITFARSPWYSECARTALSLGLSPLQDQQLAGLVMGVLSVIISLVPALALFTVWLRQNDW